MQMGLEDGRGAQAPANRALQSETPKTPGNIMTSNRDLAITSVNHPLMGLIMENLDAFRQAVSGLEPGKLIGSSIDQFHRDPAYQRYILSNPRNFPHKTVITIASTRFALDFHALFNENGAYIGVSAAWEVTKTAPARPGEFDIEDTGFSPIQERIRAQPGMAGKGPK